MTDIWDEKPEWWTTEPEGLGREIYYRKEMDAWLDKLKKQWDELVRARS